MQVRYWSWVMATGLVNNPSLNGGRGIRHNLSPMYHAALSMAPKKNKMRCVCVGGGIPEAFHFGLSSFFPLNEPSICRNVGDPPGGYKYGPNLAPLRLMKPLEWVVKYLKEEDFKSSGHDSTSRQLPEKSTNVTYCNTRSLFQDLIFPLVDPY